MIYMSLAPGTQGPTLSFRHFCTRRMKTITWWLVSTPHRSIYTVTSPSAPLRVDVTWLPSAVPFWKPHFQCRSCSVLYSQDVFSSTSKHLLRLQSPAWESFLDTSVINTPLRSPNPWTPDKKPQNFDTQQSINGLAEWQMKAQSNHFSASLQLLSHSLPSLLPDSSASIPSNKWNYIVGDKLQNHPKLSLLLLYYCFLCFVGVLKYWVHWLMIYPFQVSGVTRVLVTHGYWVTN